MGFRSVMISEDRNVKWPAWLLDKHPYLMDCKGVLSTKWELKTYQDPFKSLPIDIQTALNDFDPVILSEDAFSLIYLHECSGITKVQIHKDKILYAVPDSFILTGDEMGHMYCYGCSDLDEEMKR